MKKFLIIVLLLFISISCGPDEKEGYISGSKIREMFRADYNYLLDDLENYQERLARFSKATEGYNRHVRPLYEDYGKPFAKVVGLASYLPIPIIDRLGGVTKKVLSITFLTVEELNLIEGSIYKLENLRNEMKKGAKSSNLDSLVSFIESEMSPSLATINIRISKLEDFVTYIDTTIANTMELLDTAHTILGKYNRFEIVKDLQNNSINLKDFLANIQSDVSYLRTEIQGFRKQLEEDFIRIKNLYSYSYISRHIRSTSQN